MLSAPPPLPSMYPNCEGQPPVLELLAVGLTPRSTQGGQVFKSLTPRSTQGGQVFMSLTPCSTKGGQVFMIDAPSSPGVMCIRLSTCVRRINAGTSYL